MRWTSHFHFLVAREEVRLVKSTMGIRITAVWLLLGAVACAEGDSRSEQITEGIDRDSALAILRAPAGSEAAPASPEDSLKNVWRRTQYLVDGKSIEVIWYSPTGEKWLATDTVPEERVIPVVVMDGKVVGVGRVAYEVAAEQYKLPKNKY